MAEWPHRMHSIDGRTFAGAAPIDLPLLAGDFVLFDTPGVGTLLGQVLDKRASGRTAQVSGALRAVITPDGGIGPVEP